MGREALTNGCLKGIVAVQSGLRTRSIFGPGRMLKRNQKDGTVAVQMPSVVGMELERANQSDPQPSTSSQKRGIKRKASEDDDILGTLVVRLVMSINIGLSSPIPDDDEILRCGQVCLSTLRERPDIVLELARQGLHTWPYKDVPLCWRRMYEDAALWCVVKSLSKTGMRSAAWKDEAAGSVVPAIEDFIDEFVKLLDTAIHLTGAPARSELIQDIFDEVENIMGNNPSLHVPEQFSFLQPKELEIRHPISRYSRPLSFESFQAHLDKSNTPISISGALSHWPAMQRWTSPRYWLNRTLGGRRLVPVEIGKQYTDDKWSQRIVPFKDFLTDHMLDESAEIGYLAQYDLFAQIPKLREDVSVPDYCHCSPPKAQAANGKSHWENEVTDDHADPLMNLWLGPSGTKTPLHTDPYSNILAQVMGYKYVRLYAPSETEKLYPRGIDDNEVDMSNTASVDVGLTRGAEDSSLSYSKEMNRLGRFLYSKEPNLWKAFSDLESAYIFHRAGGTMLRD